MMTKRIQYEYSVIIEVDEDDDILLDDDDCDILIDENGGLTADGYALLADMDAQGYFV